MGYGMLSKALKKLIAWKCDVPDLYPEVNKEIHLQMWWIRWGTKMFTNIPFWKGVSGEFLYSYIYEIPKKINRMEYIPLWELMAIVVDCEDVNKIEDNYIEYMKCEGINKYFGNNHEMLAIVKKIFGVEIYELNERLYDNNGVYDVVLIGNGRDDTGLGVDKVTISEVLKSIGLNVKVLSNDDSYMHRAGMLFLALPLPSVYVHFTKDLHCYSDASLIVAHTPWELSEIPKILIDDIDRIKKIFFQSKFVEEGYLSLGVDKARLKYLPPVVDVICRNEKEEKEESIEFLEMENRFNVIVAYDLSSYQSRKNPFASIDSYIKAFPNEGKTSLCVKINSKNFENLQYQKLVEYLKLVKRSDIWICEGIASRVNLIKFYARFDCLLHLHRSEGFGRNIAEFMSLGIPVVCTAYSGNMDYCSNESAYLVDYDLVPVAKNEYLFAENAVWANPKIDDAAEKLRNVYQDPKSKNEKIINANKAMKKYTLKECAINMLEGLK